ncbi:undecaprenyl-diphosphate phosphatase [Haloferula rosea]|uniref:Undecaprenyl-diphosphatase n=1 Tax=Haloferula rosea TaxID=490093 RepID=A0A934RDM3_9BACT|nr:undecaprenyl-diphosphate phosphatase [Haloferula rosea]MBK1828640.1 undecaprenyl-diphosphate phosphatase [Haloferula rosea]
MNWIQALILGVIEGLTEYLPVSSTGHLIVAQRFMGIGMEGQEKQAADCFAICIQAGAILAVLGLYWPRVRQMLMGLLGKDRVGLRLLMAMVVGFLPAAVIGLLANDWIEARLFGLKPVVAAWLVGGVGILFVARWMKRGGGSKGVELAELTWKMALIVGLAQCVAMWPGTSRSLMTILGGVLVGLRLSAAVEFSFLLGLVTLTAATAKKAVWPIEGIDERYDAAFGGTMLMLDTYDWMPMLVGVVGATVSAALAVKWMVGYLNRKGLGVFGWYRIAVGIAVGGLILTDFHGFGSA